MNISEEIVREIIEKALKKASLKEKGAFEKKVDKSGILIVRTETVKPAPFEHGERVCLTDIVSIEESPRMGAGVMELDNTELEWTLTYD